MIKKLLINYLPPSIIKIIKQLKMNLNLILEYRYDYKIYSKHNGARLKMNIGQLEGKIIAHYHVLEKGMSHPTPKNCFSIPIVKNLIKLINVYDSLCFSRSKQVEVAAGVLKKYINFHSNQKCLSSEIIDKVSRIDSNIQTKPSFLEFSRDEYFKFSDLPFKEFALSRYTVRDFIEKNVELSSIENAIKIAQKTPSVCNRQTFKAHVLTKKTDILNHLNFQTGNRGFGTKINKLIIITSDINLFEGPKERNQLFIDGGMFAMSLLYALHHLKLGAVCLNWSYNKKQNNSLHALGLVPENEKVILFIGVGHVPENFKVAVSEKRELLDILDVI